MKQVVLALTVISATFALGLLAVAVAQKDSRDRPTTVAQIPDYSRQEPVPIPMDSVDASRRALSQGDQSFDMPPPPGPIVRANDSMTAGDYPTGSSNTTPLPAAGSGFTGASPFPSSTAQASLGDRAPGSAAARGGLSDDASSDAEVDSALADAGGEGGVEQAAYQDGGAPVSSFSSPFPSQPYQPTQQPSQNPAMQDVPPSLQGNPSGLQPVPTAAQPNAFANEGSGPLATPPVIRKPSPPSQIQGSNPTQNPYLNPLNDAGQRTQRTEPQGTAVFTPPAAPPNPFGIRPGVPVRAAPEAIDPNASSIPGATASSSLSSQPPVVGAQSVPSLGRNNEMAGATVRDVPGERLLDGAQTPSLQIHKKAPEEIQVGQAAVFSILVRNIGNFTAHDVRVYDRVPRGTRLVRTSPQAQQSFDGALVWNLGELPTGAEQTISIELVPEVEGEIGSVANVTFNALASVRTISTQARLEMVQTIDPTVLIGEKVLVHIQVTNTGTGTARNVTVEEDVPAGLRHPLGPALGLDPFDLAPGQTRTIDLELFATEPGVVRNQVRAKASNAQAVEATAEVKIVAPMIRLAATGPTKRYLERQANYQITITNTGTATARNIDLMAYLPRGMQFNSAGNQGEYMPEQHATVWNLEELAPGATATTDLTVMPIEEGDFVLRLQCQADGIQAEPFEKPIKVDGQSELAFSIDDENDPIETDGQTTYIIRLSNVGTRSDQNVIVQLELPSGAQVVNVRAPVGNQASGGRLNFDPIPELKAKDQAVFQVTVKLPTEGTQVARAFVRSQIRPTPVVKEESTEVYLDR